MSNNKIIVILGPTASGKSSVAIKLAQKFNGEIISADSRQIYQSMEINTGAEPVKKQVINDKKIFFSHNIPHYFVSIISPTEKYSVVKYKKEAEKIISDILQRGKIPIICGGTGFWIKALVDNVTFPSVKPNLTLRKKLALKNTNTLFAELRKIDPQRAKTIDPKNKVRLIRALEICQKLGTVPLPKKTQKTSYSFLQIGIKRTKKELHQRILLNVKKRMQQGMITEIKKLHQELDWKEIENFGLSFRLIPQYLKGKIQSLEELMEKIYLVEKNYAKRQITWFKKDPRIQWSKDYASIEKLVHQFLNLTKKD